MTISLTGTGGLFTRLQTHTNAFNTVIRLLRTGTLTTPAGKTLGTAADEIAAQYASTRQDLIADLYDGRDDYRAVHADWLGYLRTLARDTVINMADDDASLPARTLYEAVSELYRQMVVSSDSVLRPTVSTSVAAISGTGTGKLIATHLGSDGLPLVFMFDEPVRVRCTDDSFSGEATQGQEEFSIKGTVAQTDPLAYDWPLGSGASTTITAIDADQAATATGQLLENGSWDTDTTSNNPDNWTIATGSAGTTVLCNNSNILVSTGQNLAFAGNGSELTSLTQTFGVTPTTTVGAGGTSLTLLPSTTYGVNCWVKVSSTPAAGVLEIALTDSGGTILQVNSTDQKVTQDLTAVSTTYVAVNGFLRTPAVLNGTGYKLRVRLSTALSNTHSLYLDHLSLTPATQAYTGGPFLALFSGATHFVLNDLFTVTVANNYQGLWLFNLDRLLGLRTLGVSVPHVAAAQTITEPTITAF
jgi:hypothetical protein